MTNIKELDRFNNWMLKIKNIHYSDNIQMLKAYNKIENVNNDAICIKTLPNRN